MQKHGWNLEDITLSEISKSQKDKYFMISLYEVSKTTKFTEAERRMVAGGSKDGKGWELLFSGYKVSVMQDKYVLEIYCTT